MLAVRRFSVVGVPILLGALFCGSRYLHAAAAVRSNKTYVSIRNEWEFNQLLPLPTPLLANFYMPGSKKSQMVSSVLEEIVKSNTSHVPIGSVDVGVDEPGNNELFVRYLISQIPTIVLLEGGLPTNRLTPRGETVDELQKEIRGFVDSIK